MLGASWGEWALYLLGGMQSWMMIVENLTKEIVGGGIKHVEVLLRESISILFYET